MAPLDLDKYVEIARQCKYLPENDLKVIQLVDKRSLIQKFQCVRTSELFPRKPKFVFSVFRGGLTQFKLRAVKD